MISSFENNNFVYSTKLVLLHKKKNQLFATQDSIYRLKLTLKKRKFQDSIEYGQCCICTRTYDVIVKDSMENIAISDCNHIFCLTCYLSMIESNQSTLRKTNCPICKTQNKSYLVFSLGEQTDAESLNMIVNSIKRLDLDYYQNLKCNTAPDCQNYALFVCDLCHKTDSQSCISCSSSPHQTILQQYNSTIFYCGCRVDAEEICFQSQASSYLQKLKEITTQSNRDLYLQQALLYALRQKNAVNNDNSKKYCPFCPHYSHAKQGKINEHIRHVHAEFSVKHGYAETMCFRCNTAFVSQKTMAIHICKKNKASKSFSQKILSGAKHNQLQLPPIQKKIAPNSPGSSKLDSFQVQMSNASASLDGGNQVLNSNISLTCQATRFTLTRSTIPVVSQEPQSQTQEQNPCNQVEELQLL